MEGGRKGGGEERQEGRIKGRGGERGGGARKEDVFYIIFYFFCRDKLFTQSLTLRGWVMTPSASDE